MSSDPSHFPLSLLLQARGALHLLTYGTLLGTTLYQSFVMTKVCYQALPTAAFTTLQKKVFPIYFRLQTLSTTALILTYPFGLPRLVKGWDGTMLLLIEAIGLLNWRWYGPLTSRIMSLRIHQGTRPRQKRSFGVQGTNR